MFYERCFLWMLVLQALPLLFVAYDSLFLTSSTIFFFGTIIYRQEDFAVRTTVPAETRINRRKAATRLKCATQARFHLKQQKKYRGYAGNEVLVDRDKHY